MNTFLLRHPFPPTPPQQKAAREIIRGLNRGNRFQTLLGVTGSGKTYTIAQVIAGQRRPVLVISHNKTLAAQLYQEFKTFFPNNAVHYFVSYYDYYQPEAYIPASDTYIEKDAKVNEEIDRLRHATTQDLLTRDDVIVVASVSCIYNIGDPDAYKRVSMTVRAGQALSQKDFLKRLVALGYLRNDIDFRPGTFRVRANLVEIFLVTGKEILSVEFSKNTITSLVRRPPDPRAQSEICNLKSAILYPAHFWVTPENRLAVALGNIELELQDRLARLAKQNKTVEAYRLERRVRNDLAMLRETGYCHGVENYSGHLEFRKAGDPPFTLLDYYQKNFLTVIDESHMTIPQLRGMIAGDRARKETLIEYGFRLPSAKDNRPLEYEEFLAKTGQIVFTSATPAPYEKNVSSQTVELLVRPTGLLEPVIEVRTTKGQLQDAIREIKKRVGRKERVLVTTLTKRLAEDLAEYLREEGVRATFLHSEVKTLERPALLAKLRKGEYDVLVGINLLREGLDLPEVSLVVIFDADKEGFLRSETTFLQIMGRAARHPKGYVIMYADSKTGSMRRAIREVARRRRVQASYNKAHRITPSPVRKEIRPWLFGEKPAEEPRTDPPQNLAQATAFEKKARTAQLRKEMKEAVRALDFERAAKLRDLINKLGHGTKG